MEMQWSLNLVKMSITEMRKLMIDRIQSRYLAIEGYSSTHAWFFQRLEGTKLQASLGK